ncbi:MAG: hypothetical protein EPGJADBJ_02279 [Saprospiraceae bacterium]|nr:hypothetical protein [Saprospiraceae bacterium]
MLEVQEPAPSLLIEKTRQIMREIQDLYCSDDTPWVVGYSGGKDSTAVLQMTLFALAKLPKDKLVKEVHVLSNDTLVENPAVANYIDKQLALIEKAGKVILFSHQPELFVVTKVVPKIEDRFWINLIGKGYPSPNRFFRWCTERMKITPTNDYIKQQVSRLGKALVVLGTRKAESSNRSRSIEKYDLQEISGNSKVRKHSLPNSWMYAPITDLTTAEVWEYLMAVPSFWGGNNRNLAAMYRNASDNAAECPLVIDTSTASCGNSRFGCWVCTVVNRDKSMENLIENGEEWMQPLLDFRDYLQEVRNDESVRMPIDRLNRIGHLGPFNFDTRAEILERLLQAEVETGQEIISRPELSAIQLQWNYDGNFKHRVSDIYQRVKQKPLAIMENDKRLQRDEEEQTLLREVAYEHEVNPNHIQELMLTEKEYASFLKRRNIFDDIFKKIEKFTIENSLPK